MAHETARRIFEEIRSRPYRVSDKIGMPADNCYFKGVELLQRLGVLGYAVRGRVGETRWDRTIIPDRIVDLYPARFLVTHFYVEAEIEGAWRILDPSFDPALRKAGFRIAEWDGENAPCFDMVKVHSQEEAVAYQAMWNDPVYALGYFEQAGAFLTELNAWLDSVRA